MKPRLAFLLPNVGVYERGAETWTVGLASRLRDDFDVTILCRGSGRDLFYRPPLAERLTRRGVPHPRARWGRRVAERLFLDPINLESLLFSLGALPHLLQARYDLLVPVNGVWGSLVARVARRVVGSRFITVGQAGIGRPDYWQARMRPDRHVVLSEAARRWIAARLPDLPVTVIPNAVDLDQFSPLVAPLPLALDRPVVLCVAALIPHKRIDATVHAVARLPRGSLVLLGLGPQRAAVEALAAERLGRDRFLLSVAPHAEIARYYAACDVFTLASARDSEAFGIAYVEAMACNKPVVATDDAIRREVVGDAGLYLDRETPEAYAETLQRALGRDFGERPRRQAEKFSWDSVAGRYRELFEAVLDSRGRVS